MSFAALPSWEQWVVILLAVSLTSVAVLAWLFVLISWYGTFEARRDRRRGTTRLVSLAAYESVLDRVRGPILHSGIPHTAEEFGEPTWEQSDLLRDQQYQASFRLILIFLDGDHLVVRDRVLEHRFPVARRDPVNGVHGVHIVEETITQGERSYTHDLLVGLNRSHERIFQCYLGWPPDAVREFCRDAGLVFGRVHLRHRSLAEAYPKASGFVKLRDSDALRIPVRIGLLVAVALPAYPMLLVARWVSLAVWWLFRSGAGWMWGSG